MNKFWLKMAVLGVVVVGVVVAVRIFSSSESGPVEKVEKPKTFYDVTREDDIRLRAEPDPQQQRKRPERTRPTRKEAAELDQQPKELTIEEKVQAERLFEAALFERKKARLPGMTYKRMVQYCRQIIKMYPGGAEAAKARRMLAEVPEHKRERYDITDEELGL